MIAQQCRGDFLGLGGALDKLHAVLLGVFLDRALAAAAGVDLGLDDGDWSAELRKRGGGFVGRASNDAARHGNAGVAQDLLGLKFVNLHWGSIDEQGFAVGHVSKCFRERKGAIIGPAKPQGQATFLTAPAGVL